MGYSLIFFICLLNSLFGSSVPVLVSKNQNITFLGDAHFQENGRICLTNTSSTSPSSSSIGVGRAFYSHPIQFRNLSSKVTASFMSQFSFTLTPDFSYYPPLFGDGLAFVIASNPNTIGTEFGYMGLSNQSIQEQGMYFAVEFDTNFDPILGDISDNHIGIDTNSIISFPTVDLTPMGFDLKNATITAWVEYKDADKRLEVWLSYNESRGIRPVLSTYMNLSGYIRELMYVGFSASNRKGSSANHIVNNWEFETRPFGSLISFQPRIEGGCSGNEGASSGKMVLWVLIGAATLLCVRKIFSSNGQSGGAESQELTDAPAVVIANPGKKRKSRRNKNRRLRAAAPVRNNRRSAEEDETRQYRIGQVVIALDLSKFLSKGTILDYRGKYARLNTAQH
ncbi:hypothetical protein MKX01_014622 [Papaver californicum]|nr:hypothetical protein MKX01_014622 [Papaver californicum]